MTVPTPGDTYAHPVTLTGCPTCDWHGPDLPLGLTPTTGELRDWHRAWHNLGRALIEPLTPLVRRINAALTREDTP